MDTRQLVTFRTVARTLHFTRAAEALGYVQSSVTAQVQGLERELGAQLFDRLGKQVRLTAAGERLLRYADQILRLVDEARVAVAEGDAPAGILTIGAPETLCAYRLPPVIAAFRAAYPRVRLIFRPGISSQLRRDVLDGRLDLAFLLDQQAPTHQLHHEALLAEPLLMLAPAQHPLAGRSTLKLHDIQDETIMLTEAGGSYRMLLEAALAAAHLRPITLEFASVEALKQCVIASLGIALLPQMAVVAELRDGLLRALPLSPVTQPLATQIVWHRERWQPLALQAFIATSRAVLGAPEE
ncbi:MAG: LysR family transcriptional regulator [Chloroflexales bacterium]|nr:LysR family transcriptional regulator [Chloroflexales bacterium]